MIAKNIKGKSFGGCVRYVINSTSELLEAEGVFADNIESIIHSFAMQRANRSEIKQPVGHIPLSFSREDKPRMTNDFMLQLAKEYMQEMGIGNTQYIVVRHHNIDNDHLHIVYNRIDNDLKLISVNNDYQRNIAVCKKLKDRHNLTYGEGKEKVQRQKLNDPDKTKYQIHDAIEASLLQSTDYKTLASQLIKHGITIQFKYRRGTDTIEGVSFAKNGLSFKGSQIDRKFSHKNLMELFGIVQRYRTEVQQKKEQPTSNSPIPRPIPQVQSKPQVLPSSPPISKNPTIFGVQLRDEQMKILQENSYIYLENMLSKTGQRFSAYVITDDKLMRAFTMNTHPEEYVKYGKYEMRAMDKRRIEAGCVTRANVKWYGIGNFACPYIWKVNPTDTEYQVSWSDPRVPENQPQPTVATPTAPHAPEPVGKTISGTVQSIAETVSDVASALDFPLESHGTDYEEENFRKRMEAQQKKKRGRRM